MSTSECEKEQRFKKSYVTVSEISSRLNVTKAAVSKALARGDLPKPIFISCRFALWEREEITPYIERWLNKSRN